jgi:hypothetical protein
MEIVMHYPTIARAARVFKDSTPTLDMELKTFKCARG